LKHVSERQIQTTSSSSSSSSSSSNKIKKSDAMIAKFTGGLCFAFNTNDSNMYVVLLTVAVKFTVSTSKVNQLTD